MISKDSAPSSPIGVQWEFQPRSAAFNDVAIRAAGVDVWSLPLEVVMSYGGAVSDFVHEISERSHVAFRSSETSVGDASRWDLVHRSQLSETLNSMQPAYVVFDALTLKAGQLPAFEKEIYRETDATPALPHGRDVIFLKELLTHTRLQLSLDLDDLPENEKERAQILEMIFKDPLRVAEIRIRPTNAHVALWQSLSFDYSCSSAVIVKWDERQVPWSQIQAAVLQLQALRTNLQLSPFHETPLNAQTSSALENAFADIFPKLKREMPEEILTRVWSEFSEALVEESSREWEPYAQLRLWPMFLKMHARDAQQWIDLAQTEWARFSAAFHPADEVAECEKLAAHELKTNPSLQTVRRQNDLWVIARNRHLAREPLNEGAIDWMGAAIIDEVSEAAKLNEAELLQNVADVAAPTGPQPGPREWQAALEQLIQNGYILKKNSADL